jgi:histone H1/5
MLIEKEMKMSKTLSTLASALKQARIDLANAKLEVARLAEGVKLERANAKAAKAATAEAKAAAATAKREAAIAKAQARLEKLLAKQVGAVGAKAIKANKRPSKAVTFGAEDNAIAAAIMARKATA